MKFPSKSSTTLIILVLLLATNYLTAAMVVTIMDYHQPTTLPSAATPAPTPSESSPIHAIGDSIDIRDIPNKILRDWRQRSQKFIYDDEGHFYFINEENDYQPLMFKEFRLNEVKKSPILSSKVGFMIYPNHDHISDIALMVMDLETKEAKEVYRRDIRTSNWEWDGPDRVIVYYNCGTACLYAFKIDVETGETVDKYHVITDYEPPTKQ